MNSFAWAFVALSILWTVTDGSPTSPIILSSYENCTSSSQCPENECCVMGMNRNPIPICTRMRVEGEPCRPGNAPQSTSLHYPDGSGSNLTDVYYSLCGCAPGLECSRKTGHCEA